MDLPSGGDRGQHRVVSGAGRAILWGTLAVGVLDGLFAVIFFELRGVSPIRVFQGVAAGLLGRESFRGGLPTFFLGLGLHFFIAFGVASVYFLASRRIDLLTRRPVPCGMLYGVLVYLFMNYVVIPLSAAGGGGKFSLPLFLNGVIGHAFLVGLPAALAATLADRKR